MVSMTVEDLLKNGKWLYVNNQDAQENEHHQHPSVVSLFDFIQCDYRCVKLRLSWPG